MSGEERRRRLDAWADDIGEEVPVLDGLDDCIVGIVDAAGRAVVCYDWERCVRKFMGDGMSREEAVAHMVFNVTGSYVGEYTPAFLTRIQDIGQG